MECEKVKKGESNPNLMTLIYYRTDVHIAIICISHVVDEHNAKIKTKMWKIE